VGPSPEEKGKLEYDVTHQELKENFPST